MSFACEEEDEEDEAIVGGTAGEQGRVGIRDVLVRRRPLEAGE